MTAGERRRPSGDDRVEVRPSGAFLLAAGASPVLLVGLGSWGLIAAGEWRVVPLVLLGVGMALAVVVALDLPYRTEFGPEGVQRVCLLRHQHLAWDDIIALTRTRADRGGASRLMGRVTGSEAAAKAGGLVALVGPKRRRYLLSDRAERPDQFDRLQRQVTRWAPGLPLPRPPR